MTTHHPITTLTLRIAAATLLLAAASACSSVLSPETTKETATRNYDIPPDMCGISTSEIDMSDFFPPGEQIEESRHERDNWNACYYDIDGEMQLAVSAGIVDEADISRAPGFLLRDEELDAEPVSPPGGHPVNIWPSSARAIGTCTFRGLDRDLEIHLSSFSYETHEESVAALSRVIHPVVDALEERCAELNDSGDPDSGSDG
ncbi:hypothetical protein [Streptomyces bohaiensis]|uniref:hypothetical protein n=1 Tax=Streptomyces bohaiensis TaxID=1431344 RepID=UPI003B7E94A9